MTVFSIRLFYSLYSVFLYPLVLTTFRILSILNPKIRKGLELRTRGSNGVRPWLSPEFQNQRPIWIHCASGEFEYAKPVITGIKERNSDAKIIVSYFSPTYVKAISQFPGVDHFCPLPWDRSQDLREFLNHHQPQCLLIARTDTWPQMLREAKTFGIPSLLFAATLSQSSGRAKGLGRWSSRAVFSQLSQIFCVSEDDQIMFRNLGFENCTRVAGDTRYDQVQARLKNPKPLREELFSACDTRPILVAGSTWSEDEVVLSKVIQAIIKNQNGSIRFILAPHEPSARHLNELEALLARHEISSVRYSQCTDWREDQVLIVDQIGILAELYGKGQIAFVGGSFKKTVHSVMEPLAAGCITFVGPLHTNNREALEFKSLLLSENSSLHMVEVVNDHLSMTSALIKALKDSGSLSSKSERIRDEIRKRSGKSELVIKWALERWAP